MAKDKDGAITKVSVPMTQSMKADLIEEAKIEERSVSDTCRRLLREALEARIESRETASASK